MLSIVRITLVAVTAILPLTSAAGPTATVKNGTYVGLHQDNYNVDYFLGVPFAQPPTGQLRLQLPQSLNTSFSGTRNATQMGAGCWGFAASEIDRNVSEDCLNLNVYRPSGYENQSLPVLVWIFGGGLTQGLNADPRYNLTFMLNNSVAMGKPIVAVSINYRLNAYGFLTSPEMQAAGITNLGLRDQRLALHWINENIAAFGGDPNRVAIWGQSAGASSVSWQLLAYGGRDDGLIHAAIADSCGAVSMQPPTANASAKSWSSILGLTGCTNATDALGCLRSVSETNFTNAVNKSSSSYAPIYDGDFLQKPYSSQLKAGEFLRVPLLTGANTDEGTNFAGGAPFIGGLPTTSYPNASSFASVAANYVRNASLTDTAVTVLQALYPDLPAIGVPHTYHGRLNATFGAHYARVAALAGDMTVHRARRFAAKSWANYSVPVYSYRFNAFPLGGLPDTTGTTHFSEIQLVFDNEGGDGYLAPWYRSGSEFAGQDQSLLSLARLMSRMWISFAHDHTPNGHGICSGYNGRVIPEWPVYAVNSSDATEGYGVNYLFDQALPVLAEVEPDTYRAEAIQYLNDHSWDYFQT